jgi:hypothetical protein
MSISFLPTVLKKRFISNLHLLISYLSTFPQLFISVAADEFSSAVLSFLTTDFHQLFTCIRILGHETLVLP